MVIRSDDGKSISIGVVFNPQAPVGDAFFQCCRTESWVEPTQKKFNPLLNIVQIEAGFGTLVDYNSSIRKSIPAEWNRTLFVKKEYTFGFTWKENAQVGAIWSAVHFIYKAKFHSFLTRTHFSLGAWFAITVKKLNRIGKF